MNDCRLLVEESAECRGDNAGAGCLDVLAKEASGYWVGGFGKFKCLAVEHWVHNGEVVSVHEQTSTLAQKTLNRRSTR
jgi:hypothetical protein